MALRALRRSRSFTITAITTLALAIGLNVTVFAVMSTMLFRGFPMVDDNDRLVYVREQGRQPSQCCLSYPDFEAWRAESASFEDIAFLDGRLVAFGDGPGERTVDMSARVTSANAFGLLGVQPMLGRDFIPTDEEPGAPPVAIVSHSFWESRFGGRPDIVGHTVEIDAEPVTVIGVMPAGFAVPEREDLWIPLEHTAELDRRGSFDGYMAVGRLADGATIDSAQAELETINGRLAAEYPASNRDVVPLVRTFSQTFVGPDAATIYGSVWASGWLVLLIACANLANLTLARTLGRSHEYATRIALGAGPGRIAQQILGECLLLACAGGALGWWLAKWSVRTWAAATESRYQVLDYTVSQGVLAYLVAVSVAAALLIGLVPITRVLRFSTENAAGARRSTQGLRARRASAVLVAGQMVLAVVLLSGTGVLVRSLWNVVGAEVGVEAPERVLIGRLAVPRNEFAAPESRVAFFDSLQSRLLAVPGVESAALANTRPVDNLRPQRLEVETRAGETIGPQTVSVPIVGTDYFRTVGATTLSGREFDERDGLTQPPVVTVNESFVARFFPGEDPVGRRLRLYEGEEPGEWRTIVGVVSNIMQSEPTRQRYLPLAYLPFRQAPTTFAWFFARTRAPTDEVAATIHGEVQNLDPDLVLEDVSTLEASFGFVRDRMDLEHAEMGKHAAVAPIFAAVALLLAAVGLHAVLAHAVNQRTREIGVRMAIGATTSHIRRLVFREEMRPVALGLAIGLLVSLAVNRVLQSQLVGVSPYDPVTLAAAPIVLILVALLACQLPARRAMRVDPAVALRDE